MTSRVYIVVRHRKKETNRSNLAVYLDKHKAKARVEELDGAVKYKNRKKIWHNIEKHDVVDSEEQCNNSGGGTTSVEDQED